VVKPLLQWCNTRSLGGELAAKQFEAVFRVVEKSLAKRGIGASHQLLETLSPCVRDLPSTSLVILLSLLDKERFDVGMPGEKRIGLVAPGFRQRDKRLLDLMRLSDRRLGNSPSLATERSLVDGLRFLANAPGVG